MFPRALKAPAGQSVVIGPGLIEQAVLASRQDPRGRVILPLNESESDPCQRMLNAMQPGSYAQPHRHTTLPKAESVVVLRGSVRVVLFADNGTITHRITLSPQNDLGVDIRPGVYHTYFALEPDTVVFSVKSGPFDPATDKEFAPWAPAEGASEAPVYLSQL